MFTSIKISTIYFNFIQFPLLFAPSFRFLVSSSLPAAVGLAVSSMAGMAWSSALWQISPSHAPTAGWQLACSPFITRNIVLCMWASKKCYVHLRTTHHQSHVHQPKVQKENYPGTTCQKTFESTSLASLDSWRRARINHPRPLGKKERQSPDSDVGTSSCGIQLVQWNPFVEKHTCTTYGW